MIPTDDLYARLELSVDALRAVAGILELSVPRRPVEVMHRVGGALVAV